MIRFETGPIRPPSEATSILLRLTRNCHWNRCAFCPVYKDDRFSIREQEEILRDIDAMAAIADALGRDARAPRDTRADRAPVTRAARTQERHDEIDAECARQMAFWMCHGLRSLFLQDADALALPADRLAAILLHARAAFPSITRITSYARAKSISRKSPAEMESLRAAGLNRIHIGMESGSDTVLALVQKGVTQEEQIRAGQRVIAAHMELSEYFMPGLGGEEFSDQHAIESAKVLSAINSTFIRIRSTVPAPGTPLHRMMSEGRWTPLTEEAKVRELRAFLERLDGITSAVRSDHIMNLLEEVDGTLPDDKPRMLEAIDRFLAMDPPDRESFIVGRRIGRCRSLSDYTPSPEIDRVRHDLVARFGSVERAILAILPNFV